MRLGTKFLDFYGVSGLPDQEVDDRINLAQEARAFQRSRKNITLEFSLTKDDSITEKIHEIINTWKSEKNTAYALFPVSSESPWVLDVILFAHCPKKEVRHSLAYINLFKEELESDVSLIKDGLLNFGYFVFPTYESVEFYAQLFLIYDLNTDQKNRGVAY